MYKTSPERKKILSLVQSPHYAQRLVHCLAHSRHFHRYLNRWSESLFGPDNSSWKFNITEYILPLATGYPLPLPSYRLCISQGASTLNPMTAWAQIGCPLFYPRCSSTVINSLFKFQSRQGFNPSGIGFGCGSHSSPPSNCSWEIIPHQYGSSELSNVLEISITWALRVWLAGEIAFPLHKFNGEKRLCWFKRMTPWMQKTKMKWGILNSFVFRVNLKSNGLTCLHRQSAEFILFLLGCSFTYLYALDFGQRQSPLNKDNYARA